MAQETVKAFFKQIEEDRNLSDQYKSLLKGVAEANVDEAQATAQVVGFAAQQGFAFTAEDVQSVAAEMQGGDGELSDTQLDGVAGGDAGLDWVCITGFGWGYESGFCIVIGFHA